MGERAGVKNNEALQSNWFGASVQYLSPPVKLPITSLSHHSPNHNTSNPHIYQPLQISEQANLKQPLLPTMVLERSLSPTGQNGPFNRAEVANTTESGLTMAQPTNSSSASNPTSLQQAGNTSANSLLHLTAQCPIMERIVAHLRPKDLVPLAQTCKSIHADLKFDRSNNKANLLTKTLCPGHGIKTLRALRDRPREGNFSTFDECAGEDDGLDIETRPCVRCRVNTCDTCRIHVTSQTLVEDPGLTGYRWWAGYVLAYPTVIRLFPPDDGADYDAWNAPLASFRPQHDKGHVGLNFDSYAVGEPESLDFVLNTDLGRASFPLPKDASIFAIGTRDVLAPLWPMIEQRLNRLCTGSCCPKAKPIKRCHWTLRKHLVDNWTCVQCHTKKDEKEYSIVKMRGFPLVSCTCGNIIDFDDPETSSAICNWCKGELIVEPYEDEKDQVNDDTEDEIIDPSPLNGVEADGEHHEWISMDCVSRNVSYVWNQRRVLKLQQESGTAGIEYCEERPVAKEPTRKGMFLRCVWFLSRLSDKSTHTRTDQGCNMINLRVLTETPYLTRSTTRMNEDSIRASGNERRVDGPEHVYVIESADAMSQH